ncbi:hypothetical protein EX30DRAFT_346232 [Ascodesmis nigricans]|uniref:Uncharacterized protein n=1 Tax=Ascodesmis nigricans TaxID=341454 RepID=A0A4S2N8K6_9PEZI|nr:hypothetical protein EX30DRAFT_346232 [Ascodesmis nigricans]
MQLPELPRRPSKKTLASAHGARVPRCVQHGERESRTSLVMQHDRRWSPRHRGGGGTAVRYMQTTVRFVHASVYSALKSGGEGEEVWRETEVAPASATRWEVVNRQHNLLLSTPMYGHGQFHRHQRRRCRHQTTKVPHLNPGLAPSGVHVWERRAREFPRRRRRLAGGRVGSTLWGRRSMIQ